MKPYNKIKKIDKEFQKFVLNTTYGAMSKNSNFLNIKDMYPETMLQIDDISYEKPLTKQQIFNLQFKWDVARPDEFNARFFKKEMWYDTKYWRSVSSKIDTPEDFIREFKDRIMWDYITLFRVEFSEEFKEEFKDKLKLNERVMWAKDYDPKILNNAMTGYGGYTYKSVYIDEDLDDE